MIIDSTGLDGFLHPTNKTGFQKDPRCLLSGRKSSPPGESLLHIRKELLSIRISKKLLDRPWARFWALCAREQEPRACGQPFSQQGTNSPDSENRLEVGHG